jgi:hypothetical protein
MEKERRPRLVLPKKVIIQIMGAAPDGRPPPHATYLQSMDFEAADGRGHVVFTHAQDEAMAFKDTIEAMSFYRTQSSSKPLRPDGKPNRPLTAYNVALILQGSEPM